MSFTSARGKKIEVSEDALKKVQKLFEDDVEDQISFSDKKRKQDEENTHNIVSFQKPLSPVGFRSSSSAEEQKHETSDPSPVIKTQPSNTGPFKTLSAKKPRGFVQPRRQDKIPETNSTAAKSAIPPSKKITENTKTTTPLSEFAKYNQYYNRDYAQLLSCGLTIDVINVTAQNAVEFRFQNDWKRPFFTSSSIGIVEITQALVNSGLDAKFCTLDWVTNHYKWIVWKLASMERSFPENFGGNYLTLERVMDQLRHRYEREVNRAHRSIIKKIVERDEVSTKFIILCVAKILAPQVKDTSEPSSSEDGLVLELTDGWYGINALLDKTLTKHALLGRIFVGQKLRIFGAELSGSDIAASPLEIGNSVMLKLHANGTRRAAWYEKLGLQKKQAFRINIKSVVPDGGIIPCLEVVVQRQYPLLFMETLPDGSKVTRQLKDEESAAQMHANQILDAVAKRVDEQEKSWDARNRTSQGVIKKPAGGARPGFKAPRQSKVDINTLETGEELCHHMVETNTPPDAFMKKLSDTQQQQLQQYLDQKKQQDIMDSVQKITEDANRVVVSLLKVKISDFIPQGHLLSKQADTVLTIWRPSDDLPQLLTEGSRLKIYGTAPVKQTRSGALTTTKYTRWKTLEKNEEVDFVFSPRQPLSADGFSVLTINSEFDYVGKIVFVSESQPTASKSGITWYSFSVFTVDTTGELLQISMKSKREQKTTEGGMVILYNLLFKGRDETYGIYQAVQLDHTQTCQTSSNKAFSQKSDEIQSWAAQNQQILSQRRQYLIDLTQNNLPLSIDAYPRTKNVPTRLGSISPFCSIQWRIAAQTEAHQLLFLDSGTNETSCERFHQLKHTTEYVLDFDTGRSISKIILGEDQFCTLLQGCSLLIPGFGLVTGSSVPAMLKYAMVVSTLECSFEAAVSQQLCSVCSSTVATFVANKFFIHQNDWNAFLSGLSNWMSQFDLQVCCLCSINNAVQGEF